MITLLLTDTVTVAARAGVGNDGDPTFGAQTTSAARVENKSKLVKLADGTERQADHVVLTEDAIGLQDRVWLPGDNTTKTSEARRPLLSKSASNPAGSLTIYETYL